MCPGVGGLILQHMQQVGCAAGSVDMQRPVQAAGGSQSALELESQTGSFSTLGGANGVEPNLRLLPAISRPLVLCPACSSAVEHCDNGHELYS